MVDELKSTLENITHRIRNPFIGAFVICTLFIHWELIFLLFNFDKDCSFNDKIVLIETYLTKNIGSSLCHKLLYVFIIPALYALLLLIFYSLGKWIFSGVITFYEAHTEPFLIKKIREGGYESIENYNKLESINSRLQKEITSLKLEKRDLNLELDDFNLIKAQLKEKIASLNEFQALEETLVKYKNDEGNSRVVSFEEVMRGEWQLSYEVNNGEKGVENFVVEENKYIKDNKTYALAKYIYYNRQKRYLYFVKEFVDITRPPGLNFLIEVSHEHFIGLEQLQGNFSMVTYQRYKGTSTQNPAEDTKPEKTITATTEIIIHSAKYFGGGVVYDVTEKVIEAISQKDFEFEVGNWLSDGKDPIVGGQKTLSVDCTINGNRKRLNANERSKIKFV